MSNNLRNSLICIILYILYIFIASIFYIYLNEKKINIGYLIGMIWFVMPFLGTAMIFIILFFLAIWIASSEDVSNLSKKICNFKIIDFLFWNK